MSTKAKRAALGLAVRDADDSGDAKARGVALRELLIHDADQGNAEAAQLLADVPRELTLLHMHVRAQIRSLGNAAAAKLVAPAWGLGNVKRARERITRWCAMVDGKVNGVDMSSTAFTALVDALRTVPVEAWCCHPNCGKPAAWEISPLGGDLYRQTHACAKHVGALLFDEPQDVAPLSRPAPKSPGG